MAVKNLSTEIKGFKLKELLTAAKPTKEIPKNWNHLLKEIKGTGDHRQEISAYNKTKIKSQLPLSSSSNCFGFLITKMKASKKEKLKTI